MDNVCTLNEIVQGRLKEDKETYAFFLDVQKAYDTVWRDGLWLKLWDMGVKGRMWRVIKKMYEASRSAVFLEGEKSAVFRLEQGVAQGCSLSPILFSVFINPRRMRSEGYSSWSVCLSVCLCVCRRLFSHYRLRGGL